MDKVVLDTDIIVDFLRSKEEAVALVRKLREKGVTLATTVINLFELYWSAYKLGGIEKVRTIDKLSRTLTILPMSSHESKAAGEEIAYLESLGVIIDIRDLLIGIIAGENGYFVVTGNVAHSNRIRDLNVLEYRKTTILKACLN